MNATRHGGPRIDWSSYAEVYDVMAENNPAYTELHGRVVDAVVAGDPRRGETILDLGAGTGNTALALGRRLPAQRILAVDADARMLSHAAAKLSRSGLENIALLQARFEQLSLPPGSVGTIACVHSLYAMPDPEACIRGMAEWLRPGGRLVLCDITRRMDTRDWAGYIFREGRRRAGTLRTIAMFARARPAIRENRRIERLQRIGAIWEQAPDRLIERVQSAGLRVQSHERVYRGYSTLVVAERPPPGLEGVPKIGPRPNPGAQRR